MRYSLVILFYFFHIFIEAMNLSHLSALTFICRLNVFLFFQINLNRSFPIFLVTFLVDILLSQPILFYWIDAVVFEAALSLLECNSPSMFTELNRL